MAELKCRAILWCFCEPFPSENQVNSFINRILTFRQHIESVAASTAFINSSESSEIALHRLNSRSRVQSERSKINSLNRLSGWVCSGARVQIELNDFSIDIYDFGFGSKLKRNIFDDAIHARNMNIPLFRNEQFRYTLNATISMLIRDQINILFAGFCFSRNDVLMNTNPIHSTHANTHTAPTSICMQNVKDTTLCEQQRQQWVNKCQHTI